MNVEDKDNDKEKVNDHHKEKSEVVDDHQKDHFKSGAFIPLDLKIAKVDY